jgi:hypothetical protein
MRAMFNGICYFCKTFKPRCANVLYVAQSFSRVFCEDCRKSHKGKYLLCPEHKSGTKASKVKLPREFYD